MTPSALSGCLSESLQVAAGTSEGSLRLFAAVSNCSDCFPVTCLGQLLFCLLREINPIFLISTGQEGEAGGLTLSGQMTIRTGDWERRDIPGVFLEGLRGPCGKLNGYATFSEPEIERHRSWLPLLLFCKTGDGAYSVILSCSLRAPSLPTLFPS